MKTRDHYIKLFAHYPDVVTLNDFQRMLGGIGDSTARKLIRENRVYHFYIRCTYLIPKECVIDYILSDHYAEYKKKLNVTCGDYDGNYDPTFGDQRIRFFYVIGTDR